MQTPFTIYNPINGAIISYGTCSDVESAQHQQREGCVTVVGVGLDDMEYYFLPSGESELRPHIEAEDEYTIASDGVEEVSFSLPTGTSVYYKDGVFEDLNSFAFTSDTPGEHTFSIQPPFPYIPKLVKINAI